MIDGVRIKPLKRHADERGYLMEMLRADDEEFFERYQQSYISHNYPGVIRAWHYHLKQQDIWVCVKGMIKTALYDPREGSSTKGEVQEVFMGDDNPVMLKIPIGVYHGYKTVGLLPSLLINFPDQLYDPSDEYRAAYNSDEIPYNWDIKIT